MPSLAVLFLLCRIRTHVPRSMSSQFYAIVPRLCYVLSTLPNSLSFVYNSFDFLCFSMIAFPSDYYHALSSILVFDLFRYCNMSSLNF